MDLLLKGCISFTETKVWVFMKELGLAFPIESIDENVADDETVMIPCLLKGTHET